MKKEEIVTLIIIGIILAIDIGTLAYTKKCVAKITGDLAELEDEAVKYCLEESQNEDDAENTSDEKESNNNIENTESEETKKKIQDNTNNTEQNSLDKKDEKKNQKGLSDKNLELSSKSEDIYNEWICMNDILTFYIEHDELEKVNVQFERIIADYSVDSKEEVVPEIKEAIFILNHIEKAKANLKKRAVKIR